MIEHLRRPTRRDVFFAVGVTLFINFAFFIGATAEQSDREITPLSFLIGTVAGLLLMFRRVHPVLVLAGIALTVLPYLLAGGAGGPIGLPLWIGLYSIAAEGDRKSSAILAVISAGVASIIIFTVAPEDPSTLERVAAIGLTFVPILIGDAVRSRRALIAEADERVRLAEASTEQEAERRVQGERVRIARELHDVVAHSIATINVQAGVAAHVIDTAPEAAKQALVEIKGTSKIAMGELRAMLGVLRSTEDAEGADGFEAGPLAPSPGIDDINGLVERSPLETTFNVGGHPSTEVDPAVGLVIFRIVQEALTNTLKHTNNATSTIHLDYQSEGISVSVVDDGGSGPSDASEHDDAETGGLGLIGLQERARSVGGTFNARPRFNGGFEIVATVPYLPSESEVQ